MKRLMWFVINVLMGYLTYLAAVNGVVWAGRIVTFVVIVSAILFTITYMVEPALAEARKRGKAVPFSLSIPVEFGFLFAFVAAGW